MPAIFDWMLQFVVKASSNKSEKDKGTSKDEGRVRLDFGGWGKVKGDGKREIQRGEKG